MNQIFSLIDASIYSIFCDEKIMLPPGSIRKIGVDEEYGSYIRNRAIQYAAEDRSYQLYNRFIVIGLAITFIASLLLYLHA